MIIFIKADTYSLFTLKLKHMYPIIYQKKNSEDKYKYFIFLHLSSVYGFVDLLQFMC